ncbi:PLD nuclease N-terminal domain-containing protein [Trueperella sp. LYQ141]|uniref:PLD nuclease N-terminal domain-containing protein n=1 Tax=Trueperella sp. LYQ141 TaxID=3391058 RepID=UPI003983C5DE
MGRILPIIFLIALVIYAVMDCVRTPVMPARISKLAWLLLIILVPGIGALIWLYFKYQNVFNSGYRSVGFGRPAAPSGPVAPDDDPEFLARLEARNRRKAYEQRLREEESENTDESPASPPDSSAPRPPRRTDEDDDSPGLYRR